MISVEAEYDIACRARGEHPVHELECSIRLGNVLKWQGISIEEAERKSDGELLQLPNFGKVSLRELRVLTKHWREQPPEPASPAIVMGRDWFIGSFVVGHASAWRQS